MTNDLSTAESRPAIAEDRTDGPAKLSWERVENIRAHLLGWFAANARDLPWRRTRDPYRILVSEVMLQQTQVDRVIPYYERWLERFPTVRDLAAAPTADVITAWAGLGYNRRAVNLQRTAQYVVEKLNGEFPRDVESLLKLPGVGPYTAGAIACFAFEQDTAFLDTNMRRVLHRLTLGPDVPDRAQHDKAVLPIAAQLVPTGNGWTWNQALIEFGALQCTARKPLCLVCPLQSDCAAFPEIQSLIAALPKGARKKSEEPFTNSNRYFRGRIVDALRGAPSSGLTLLDLGPQVKAEFSVDDLDWLHAVVSGLVRDGLAVMERHAAEDSVAYDPGNGSTSASSASEVNGLTDDLHAIRVRLP